MRRRYRHVRTLEGRLIAVLLMLTGIGVIGVFTASVASFFVAGEGTDTMADVKTRLDVIERKLDALLAFRERDLAPADQQFLQELPATRDLVFEGGTMLLCHGVGRFDLEKFLSYDTEYSVRTNRYLREVTDSGKYRLMVNGHSHERLVLRAGALVVVNAGSLAHPEDPGFVLLDFPENLVRWYAVADSGVALVEEQPIFCE